MVQYAVLTYMGGTLQQDITHLSLLEAYMLAKPPEMNPDNNRWTVMMYNEVVKRIAEMDIEQLLLVAWEEDMMGMESGCNYIRRMT